MKKIKLILTLQLFYSAIFSQRVVDTSYANYSKINNQYQFKLPVAFTDFQNNTAVFKFSLNSIGINSRWIYTDPSGVNNHCFLQTKNGVPVLNSQLLIREKNDTIIDASGLLNLNIPQPNTQFSVSSAVAKLIRDLNCFKYKWQDSLYEVQIKEDKNDTSASYFPKPELAIYKMIDTLYQVESNYKYIYPINILAIYLEADSLYIDSVYYVNSSNGSIIRRFKSEVNCFSNNGKELLKSPLAVSSCGSDCNSTMFFQHLQKENHYFREGL